MLRYFIIIMLTIAFNANAGVLDNFESLDGWYVHKGSERGFNLKFYQNDSGNAAEVVWEKPKLGYFELNNRKSLMLNLPDNKMKGALSFSIYTDTPKAVRGMALRLLDSKGEVFSAKLSIKTDKSNWVNNIIALDALEFNTHWSGNNDGVMDFPVRILGFAVEINRQYAGVANIRIKEINYAENLQETEITKELWSFSKNENWIVHRNPSTVKVTSDNTMTRLVLNAAEKKQVYYFVSPVMQKNAFASPLKLVLNVSKTVNTPIRIAVRMRDSHNEIFQFALKKLTEGDNKLEYDLTSLNNSWGDKKNGKIDGDLKFHEIIIEQTAGKEIITLDFLGSEITELVPAVK